MSLFDYLDRCFTNLTVDLKDDYDQGMKAEQNAIHSILEIERTIYKYLAIPRLLIQYVLVKLGVKPIPEDKMAALKAKWKADQDAKQGEISKGGQLQAVATEVVPEVKS